MLSNTSDHTRSRAALSQLKSDTCNGAAHVKDTVATEFSVFTADVKDLVGKIREDASPDLLRLRTRLKALLANASDEVRKRALQAKSTVKNASSSTDSYVRENPYKAAGITLLLGAGLGLLAARRK